MMMSIIIPFYNEEASLEVLCEKLTKTLQNIDHELIFVDDGSIDNSKSKVSRGAGRKRPRMRGSRLAGKSQKSQSENQEKIKIISHRKRLGKGTALKSGFEASCGDVIIFIDADLQNDPDDIPLFITKIKAGYDFINGWRQDRKDGIGKTLPSSIFNWLILKPFLGAKFHDMNCGFKAMKRTVLEEIPLYGDNYRFLPMFVDKAGFKTTEIVVRHHPRLHSTSKYGAVRLFFGLIDTITTYFIYRFSEKPLHFFGLIGGSFFSTGFILSVYMTIERVFFGKLLYRRPLLLFAILLIIVGIQIIMTGIIGELIVYISQKTKVKSQK